MVAQSQNLDTNYPLPPSMYLSLGSAHLLTFCYHVCYHRLLSWLRVTLCTLTKHFSLGTHVHLLIHAIIQSANHGAAVQCLIIQIDVFFFYFNGGLVSKAHQIQVRSMHRLYIKMMDDTAVPQK